MSIDISKIRDDFPILKQRFNDYPLIYLDNAATTQKPEVVINSITQYYNTTNANVHRGVHQLSVEATRQYENARDIIRRFINAQASCECIFVRGATEAINLVASSYVTPRIQAGDEILVTHMEHHSNIVPWQFVCQNTGAVLKVAPINIQGELLVEEFEKLVGEKTKFIAINHVSNSLGTVNPIKKLIKIARGLGIKVLVDGAQAVPHLAVDVQDLDCDFYVFSGHKCYGPTGTGVLWGREALLEDMRPYQGGGEMISQVSFEASKFAPLPHKFEAGTPNIAGFIGLGAAINYLTSFDLNELQAYEAELLKHATQALADIKGFNIVGAAADKIAVLSFVHGKIHAHDVGTILDSEGIAIRSGHHCTMPLMDFYNVEATNRLSFSFYNTFAEIDSCMAALQKVKEVFA